MNPADDLGPARRQPCAMCGEPAWEWHHVTGRTPTGDFNDERFVVALCGEHHALAHADLRAQRLDIATNRVWTRLTAVEFRLARTAALIGRAAQFHPAALWLPDTAAAVRGWADDLATHRRLLDTTYPDWRHTLTTTQQNEQDQ